MLARNTGSGRIISRPPSPIQLARPEIDTVDAAKVPRRLQRGDDAVGKQHRSAEQGVPKQRADRGVVRGQLDSLSLLINAPRWVLCSANTFGT